MTTLQKTTLLAIAAGAVAASVSCANASDFEQTCDRSFARQILSTGQFDAMCSCDVVTTAFIEKVQKYRDFTTVLDVTSASCPVLTQVLTSTSTATLGDPVQSDESGNPGSDGDGPDRTPGGSGGSDSDGGGPGDSGPGDDDPDDPTNDGPDNAPDPLDNGW